LGVGLTTFYGKNEFDMYIQKELWTWMDSLDKQPT
jgi:hypothetical protein